MTTYQLRIALLVGLYACFALSLYFSASLLPDRTATHFNGAGQADGWMSRSEHLLFMGAFGLLFPLSMIGIFWSIRFLPKQLVNIPHRDYWLADERRAESTAYLGWHSIWFGALMLTFVIGLHWLIVLSNQLQPASLPFVWLMMVLGPFLLGVAGWVYCLQRHFHPPGAESQSAA